MREESMIEKGDKGASDSDVGKTIIITESATDTNDKEYEPITMDSEEIVVSIVEKKATQKSQTTITDTFHPTKKELQVMTQKRETKEKVEVKRQTRSMRKLNN